MEHTCRETGEILKLSAAEFAGSISCATLDGKAPSDLPRASLCSEILRLAERERRLREALRVALAAIGALDLSYGRGQAPGVLMQLEQAQEALRALLKESPVKASAPDEDWPPKGWKVHNPDWPAGDGPHLEPED